MREKKQVTIEKEVSEYEEISKIEGVWTINGMINSICTVLEAKREQVFNRLRNDESVLRRGLVDLICTSNGFGVTMIARETGRTHATVINSLDVIEQMLDTNRAARNLLRDIVLSINSNYKGA